MAGTVVVERVSAEVAVLRLNRPDRLNALDYTCVSELHDALDERVVADDVLMDEATEMAGQIASFTSFGLRRTKEVMWHNLDASSVAAAIALENRNQEIGAREPEVVAFMQRYTEQRVGGRALPTTPQPPTG